jgi:hypothetical protein
MLARVACVACVALSCWCSNSCRILVVAIVSSDVTSSIKLNDLAQCSNKNVYSEACTPGGDEWRALRSRHPNEVIMAETFPPETTGLTVDPESARDQ